MLALITGASSGLGKEMAYYLASLGYDLILVARRVDRLKAIKKELCVKVEIYSCDLAKTDQIFKLYAKVKQQNIDFLINNAGFGLMGEFKQTNLFRELEMIDVNIKALHVLTKLFLLDFLKRNRGFILNISSSAGFLSGPYLSTYYATKNYVTKLSLAIKEELKKARSNVSLSVLCSGPINTEFNRVANAKLSFSGLSAKKVAKYAVDKTLQKKLIIIPGFTMKCGVFFSRFIPWQFSTKIIGQIQDKKLHK